MKYHIKTWTKRIFSYENLVNVLFWNTLIMCLLLPLIVVNLTLYYLEESVDLHGTFQEGIFLRRYQLIGILLFTCTDLILFMLVKFIKDYSPIFVGCSTDLKIKLFCGSRFIPLVMFVKLVKPIELLDINTNYTSPFSWLIRLVVFLLILVNFLPLLNAEFQFLYSVGKNTPKAIQFPTTQGCPINKDVEKLLLKSYQWERKAPAILFLSIKSCLLFFFVLEVSIIDLRLNSPLSLDYPLIISTSNMLFVYFGHRSVHIKYNINETK
uniref:Uncharacterized protein n=1 Tax=Acrobeloides nanus TaxID=290746 RepID=A0A914EF34_9BILA